jgi:hypothetical protein
MKVKLKRNVDVVRLLEPFFVFPCSVLDGLRIMIVMIVMALFAAGGHKVLFGPSAESAAGRGCGCA